MKGGAVRRIVFASSALALVAIASAQSRATEVSDASAKEKILRLERERNEAIVKGDAATLDRMTADDYTFITLRGELRTKPEIVQGFRQVRSTTSRERFPI